MMLSYAFGSSTRVSTYSQELTESCLTTPGWKWYKGASSPHTTNDLCSWCSHFRNYWTGSPTPVTNLDWLSV